MSKKPTAPGLRNEIPRLRSKAISLTVDGFYRGLSRMGRLSPRADPSRYGILVARDLCYHPANHPQHRLDVYLPRRLPAPRPTLLYLHGGGFRILSKETHWVMALAFARQGFVVFMANYRPAPSNPFPAALSDACAAYRWVLEHAGRYGGDPGRMVVAGESAGANLATALTLACCFERPESYARSVFEAGVVPKVVLPACGLLQVSDPERLITNQALHPFIANRILAVSRGYLPDTSGNPDRFALADPLVLLESDQPSARSLPPFQAIVGGRDPIQEDTSRLGAALKARGVPAEIRIYPGQGHAFHAYLWRQEARQAWRDTFAFLDRHLLSNRAGRVDPKAHRHGE